MAKNLVGMVSIAGLLIAGSAFAVNAPTIDAKTPTPPPAAVKPSAPAPDPILEAPPPVTEAIKTMAKALRDVVLLVEAARADRQGAVITCLVQKMEQIGKHLRFAQKVELEQFDTATRIKDPIAQDIARSVAKRMAMVLELRAQAEACAGEFTAYMSGQSILDLDVIESHDDGAAAIHFDSIKLDTRPPPASPYQLTSR